MATNTAGHLLIADGTNFNPTAVGDLSKYLQLQMMMFFGCRYWWWAKESYWSTVLGIAAEQKFLMLLKTLHRS